MLAESIWWHILCVCMTSTKIISENISDQIRWQICCGYNYRLFSCLHAQNTNVNTTFCIWFFYTINMFYCILIIKRNYCTYMSYVSMKFVFINFTMFYLDMGFLFFVILCLECVSKSFYLIFVLFYYLIFDFIMQVHTLHSIKVFMFNV